MADIQEVFSYIDAHFEEYVKKLSDWVAIKSVSSWAETRKDVFQMVKHVAKICIYGHLDVQPAKLDDGWDTEPFTLADRDGKLYGRGSTDDKGPVLGWVNVVEAYKDLGRELPVNLKICLEGMEENGSEGLEELIISRKDTFFKGCLLFLC